MSGAGKSAVVAELRRRGCAAFDADDDGVIEPSVGGAWRWRVLFFAGCSDEQSAFDWDRKCF